MSWDINRLVDDVGEDLVEQLTRTMYEMDKVVFGRMVQSWDYHKEDKTVASKRPGIWNVEFGREPGSRVPIEPLRNWLIGRFGMEPKRASKIAYAVERKIYKNGIKPTRFVKRALEEMTHDS